MDMPLCRLRQATEAAVSRIKLEHEVQARLAEIQAKTICSFIGLSAGVWMSPEDAKNNPIVRAVEHIDFLGGKKKSREEAELDDIRGEVVAEDWRKDPRLAPQPADPEKGIEASNAEGSFEAFMAMLGGGGRGAPPPGVNGSG